MPSSRSPQRYVMKLSQALENFNQLFFHPYAGLYPLNFLDPWTALFRVMAVP